MTRQQIIEAITKRISTNCDTIVRKKTLEVIADEILALPLDVPSNKEIMGTAMTYSAYPTTPDEEPDFEPSRAEDFDNGAHWMRDEILKRNK